MSAAVKRHLILLRHGQTEYNATSRMQGQLDTDLSELGRTQAKTAAAELTMRSPLRVVSSDLARAFDTAVALGDASGLPVSTDARLRETHLGEWQGLTHLDVDAQAPGARLKWRADASITPPGGESRIDVARRSVPVVEELLAQLPEWGADASDRPVVIVAHGGLIAALTASLLDLPVDRWPVLGGLSNTSWVQLSSHGEGDALGWRLDVWNASARVASDIL
ncbi:histidine phosphatase family protein [Rhodococcus sp. PAMC28707]|uniref:histidine phosphatase family protein n=1 Tax=unclassified Rhodococcus (in: high G+C Gram-positive bacteria) TaxID=192944 RepID=UPI00109D860F|nr:MULTISPECIES: histidine phosphatase family protein [unclassified Rhodococcus (in: high G+C Gram-positive bacteria)]QCB51662.1 histidine phosphatase family protein [Rhodococcus sp. PAMC28705]QCB60170.1 histidine phosphatase family protein [Rhodococcus sp. PAMC28707]